MKTDGGLRSIFRERIAEAHWQPVETFSTGLGVPDANGCLGGVEAWVEFKKVYGWQIKISPEQIAWIERRARAGGRVFVAARKRDRSGDALWLLSSRGSRARNLRDLPEGALLGCWAGGPARWPWEAVKALVFGA